MVKKRNISMGEFYDAIDTGQFHVYFQPKIDMVTTKLVGAEALSRWIHPVTGLKFPGDYIPQLEENGWIGELDMYIYEEACRIKADWKRLEKPFSDIIVSVNMSREHLKNRDFARELADIADEYGIPHNEIELELTESVFAEDMTSLIKSVESVKAQGFYVSMDDFGSGFSSLNLLKDLFVDTIKIDKEFLHGTGSTERGKLIIKNVVALCLDLKVEVIAEGVETVEQIEFLKKCGCQLAQGFYYSRPVSKADFETFAAKYIEPEVGSYIFDFEGNIFSDDNGLKGRLVGEGFFYDKGIHEDTESLYMPGGPVATNVLHLPRNTLVSESFSVSLWMKPEELTVWTSVFYIRYAGGLFSIAPRTDNDLMVFRWWNSSDVRVWRDIYGPKLQKNLWMHLFFTFDAKNNIMRAYLDGKLVGEMDDVPSNRYVEEIIVGGDNFMQSFKGNVDEVIIYNQAKSDEFAKELYKKYLEKPINNYERI